MMFYDVSGANHDNWLLPVAGESSLNLAKLWNTCTEACSTQLTTFNLDNIFQYFKAGIICLIPNEWKTVNTPQFA